MNVCDLDGGKDGCEAWELEFFFKSETKYELLVSASLPNAVHRLPNPLTETHWACTHTHSAKYIILNL